MLNKKEFIRNRPFDEIDAMDMQDFFEDSLKNIVNSISGFGVVDGLKVTSTTDMILKLEKGICFDNDGNHLMVPVDELIDLDYSSPQNTIAILSIKKKIIEKDNIDITNKYDLGNDLVYSRDLLVSYELNVHYGAPGSTPNRPELPNDELELAEIFISSNATSINQSNIKDTRKLIEQRGGRYFNVKYLGAAGDGITDDTDAIQQALDNNNLVYLPKGIYKISKTLKLKTGHHITGDSSSDSIILQSTNNMPIINISGSHFSIERLYLQFATPQNTSNKRGYGIELGNEELDLGAYEGIVRDVQIFNSYHGIAVPYSKGKAFAFECIFQHVRVLDAWDYSFHLYGTGNINLTTNTFLNCYSLHEPLDSPLFPEGKGFFLGAHDNLVMIDCAVDHCRDKALFLNWNQSATILGFHVELCGVRNNYSECIFVNHTNADFSGVQINSLEFKDINEEAYVLYAADNSNVQIRNMRQRMTTKVNSPGEIFSLVCDTTSKIVADGSHFEFDNVLNNAKSTVNFNHGQNWGIPIGGKWESGDIIWNRWPSLNSPMGWICTVAGEFGTASTPIFEVMSNVGTDTILFAPNGDGYKLSVDSNGAIITTKL